MNRQFLCQQLARYTPFNLQEEKDRLLILSCLSAHENIFTRENPFFHMTASAWVVNPARDKILMAYHNLYDSWAWLGGHADGQTDLLAVALKETREESGLEKVQAVTPHIFSLEVLSVDGHMKKGKYVNSHLHLNLTYLLQADDRQPLLIKPDENSAVGWFSLDDGVAASREPWYREHVYSKLNLKLRLLQGR